MNALERMENTQTGTRLRTYSPTSTPEKDRQVAHLVQQCFAIQDIYGKSPEQLKALMQAMMEDLKPYSLERIQTAFRNWRRESSKIPTVADILKLISPPLKQYEPVNEGVSDYQSLTSEEKKNLSNLMAKAERAIQSGEVNYSPKGAVPWFGKVWSQMDDNLKSQLRAHVTKLMKDHGKERAEGYILYLQNHAKVPPGFFAMSE